ncbi:hypothetical protein CBR_g4462 [Chara braunii]|uniref:Annexin n=1 Tax=Chara braunii TaxID=69332 RepID=A0A388KHV8_CHABU|nr:hypothetical protein CBR_g4462 [Chara braunii]|eukprot:GBG69632.1 hypothetical protein CBR_g4462 [Chara braunii]
MAVLQLGRGYDRFEAEVAAYAFIRALDALVSDDEKAVALGTTWNPAAALEANQDQAVAELIRYTAYPSFSERRAMVETAATLHGRDIVDEVRRKTSGDFQKGLLALVESPAIRDAEWIHKSVSGLLNRKGTAREILCTRTTYQLRAIADAYYLKHGKDMVSDVLGAFSGKERKLYERLLTFDRVESHHADRDQARILAQALYEAGPARWGADEGTFIDILTTESADTIRAVFREYEALYGTSLFTVMDDQFSGNFEKDLLMLSKFLLEPAKAFADIIHKALTGLRTDGGDLVRAIIARKDMDLWQIKEAYELHHGSLMRKVESATSGDFRSLLMAVIASVA